METKTNRIYIYDNLKFFLILCVVVGHFCENYVPKSDLMKGTFIFIYTFHMPAFILLSGLFHKPYKKDDRFASSRFFYFLFLGIILKIIKGFTALHISGKFSFHVLSESSIPWFLLTLAAYELLSYLFREINPRMVLILSFLLGTFCGYDETLGTYLILSRILVYAPYFFIGLYLTPEKLQQICTRLAVRICSILVLALYTPYCFLHVDSIYRYRRLFTGQNNFSKVTAIANCGFQHRLLTYVLVLIICAALIGLTPNRRLPFITTAGTRTLAIYFFHLPIIQLLYAEGCFDTFLLWFPANIRFKVYLLLPVLLTVILSWKPFTQVLEYVRKQIPQR